MYIFSKGQKFYIEVLSNDPYHESSKHPYGKPPPYTHVYAHARTHIYIMMVMVMVMMNNGVPSQNSYTTPLPLNFYTQTQT